jgi:hypothetical protein
MNRVKAIILAFFLIPLASYGDGFEHFITTDGYNLMDGDKVFRFISWNIPNLNYVEDDMTFTDPNPYDLPTEFEMRDAFETIKEMGGQAIRIYTIPVRNNNFPEDAPTFVEAPGEFNEEAFKVNDLMLALANEYQIRIIFSLLNNWQWMGGRPNYAEFRGKESDEFWTDAQLIKDFKETIKFTINRKNTITGVKYKDDKAIMCWETGNELESPYEWTKEIAAYIKKLDKNHLLLDGYFAIDNKPIQETSITDPNIDIVSSHHYERNPFDMISNIDMNLKLVQGRKPYLVGEFGFESSSGLLSVIDKVIDNEQICGALSWSIRYRHRNGGFYWHSEPLGDGIYKSFHWPGFHSGEAYDERNFLQAYREKAFEIQGIEAPPASVPKAPNLLPIKAVHDIRWQGSAGAEGYHIERADESSGPWKIVGYHVSDADIQTFAAFHDQSAKVGRQYYYRAIAVNASGASEPSNIIGPVLVENQALVDNMLNYGVMYFSKDVKPVSGEDRTYKEIDSRIAGEEGAEIIYMVPGSFTDFKLYAFEGSLDEHHLDISVSEKGNDWRSSGAMVNTYASKESNYDYGVPKIYSLEEGEDIKYFKIVFKGKLQIARVEIEYK